MFPSIVSAAFVALLSYSYGLFVLCNTAVFEQTYELNK